MGYTLFTSKGCETHARQEERFLQGEIGLANQEQLDILTQGIEAWNQWRIKHPDVIRPDLKGANLREANLRFANLSKANLSKADLREADLIDANLSGANLSGANLSGAHFDGSKLSKADLREANLKGAFLGFVDLREANLSGADLKGALLNGSLFRGVNFSDAHLRDADLSDTDLSGVNLSGVNLNLAELNSANLSGANLSGAHLYKADFSFANLSQANLSQATLSYADLSGADLSGAHLESSTLVETNLTGATLTHCSIYGISVWNVRLEGTKQDNLVITPLDEPTITVDNLKIAQFIYLLLNNAEIRDVIDTIAKKAVLILGRFTPERKAVLDALREALRTQGYLPILFDFDKPSSQDLTETVSTLAHLSRFIIVDLTDPSSAPYEVGTIALNHIKPIQALFQPSNEAKRVFAMFPDLIRRYDWVLPPYEYQDQEQLLASLQTKVITPAEQKAQELEKR
jgi:uncharacterized protein YjbI with pentapeptide repeats